jgi:hypothetical protein
MPIWKAGNFTTKRNATVNFAPQRKAIQVPCRFAKRKYTQVQLTDLISCFNKTKKGQSQNESSATSER